MKKTTSTSIKNVATEKTPLDDFQTAVKALLQDSTDVRIEYDGRNWKLTGTTTNNYKKLKETIKEIS